MNSSANEFNCGFLSSWSARRPRRSKRCTNAKAIASTPRSSKSSKERFPAEPSSLSRAPVPQARTDPLQLPQLPTTIDLELGGILSEVGNIVLNGVMGTISNLIGDRLDYSLSRLVVDTDVTHLIIDDSLIGSRDPAVLIADAQFDIDNRGVSGWLLVVFHVGSVEEY